MSSKMFQLGMGVFLCEYEYPHAVGLNEGPVAGLSTHMSGSGGSLARPSSHPQSTALFLLSWPVQLEEGRMNLPAQLPAS